MAALPTELKRFFLQAPNFVGILTFPGWSFPDKVLS